MKKSVLIVVIIILIISIAAIYFNKFLFDSKPYVLKEKREICETESPLFDYEEECQKYINANYKNKDCILDITDIRYSDFGSCGDCFISCIE